MVRADVMPRPTGADRVDSFGLRRQMLLRIAALEKMIPNVRGSAAGGGNHAVESIEPVPFCDQDLEAVEASLAILEAQSPQPPTAATRAIGAAAQLSSFGERIKAHVARRADIFASKPSTLVGPKFGNRLLLYYVFADKLLAIVQAALDWLNEPTRDLRRASVKLAAGNRGPGNPSPTPRLLRGVNDRSGATDQALYERTPSEVVNDVAGVRDKARLAPEQLTS